MKRKIRLIAALLAAACVLCSCTFFDKSDGGENNKSEPVKTESISAAESAKPEDTQKPKDTKKPNKPRDNPETDYSMPSMWHVTSDAYEGELYLLGSIHLGDDNTNNYSAAVMDAFLSCEYLAVETDITETDAADLLREYEPLKYKDKTTIKDHISPELYERAYAILQETGLMPDLWLSYNPVFWYFLIDELAIDKTDYSSLNGVDMFFLTEAHNLDKPILTVDDRPDVYSQMAALDEKTLAFVLESSVESYEKADELNEYIAELYKFWRFGREDEYEDPTLEEMTDEEKAMYDSFDSVLMDGRNEVMADRADEYIRDGRRVFFVVGSAHMYENDGLVSELANRGYKVEKFNTTPDFLIGNPLTEALENQKAA